MKGFAPMMGFAAIYPSYARRMREGSIGTVRLGVE